PADFPCPRRRDRRRLNERSRGGRQRTQVHQDLQGPPSGLSQPPAPASRPMLRRASGLNSAQRTSTRRTSPRKTVQGSGVCGSNPTGLTAASSSPLAQHEPVEKDGLARPHPVGDLFPSEDFERS